MVSPTQARQTSADLELLEQLPENEEKWFELIDGIIYEVAMTSPDHTYTGNEIYVALRAFVKARALGYAFADGCSYVLPNGAELIPDASFVSKIQATRPFPSKFPFAPDLAVEVVSPSNSELTLLRKVELYLANGSQAVWVVYPEAKVVYIYHSADD
ncbi:MAG: Uma2 family endonuclease, partial [Armatimonadetes bacterium]|nr:Uma2 family endonuclease [Anaerolineae bacterium]